jgi:GMP synthase (glutamine-hydrolysing)
MRVLALNHGPLVRAELFGDVIVEAGHDLLEWELPTRGRPPEGFDAVLVLGGDMNVGEELEHPWLLDEYDLLRNWVESGTPLLGICLGAQTLAHAFGGRVDSASQPQMGFSEVHLTEQGKNDPLLGVLPPRFEALLGNAYAFEVPTNAVELARSEIQSQAFRVGERAWGVQFHPEARRAQFKNWFELEPAESRARPLEEVEQELEAKMDDWHDLGRNLCRAFLATATTK